MVRVTNVSQKQHGNSFMALDDLLDEHEQSERVRSWVRSNALGLIGGVALGLGAIAGWQWWQGQQLQRGMAVNGRYAEVVKNYEAGRLPSDKGRAALDQIGKGNATLATLAALQLAKAQTEENPVYYVQYAHARVCSVLDQWGGEAAELAGADLGLLQNERELALCARLASFAELVQDAAAGYAPHQIAFYLKDLAADFHSWYNAERMLVEDEALKLARLALAAAVRQVLVTGLKMLGVSAPESM